MMVCGHRLFQAVTPIDFAESLQVNPLPLLKTKFNKSMLITDSISL